MKSDNTATNKTPLAQSVQKYKKFSLREFGGSFGDWGTLVPFIIGYVLIIGLNPAGIFLCLGITNIILGIKYNLPLPVQPQKTIASVAIAEKWDPNLVISTGFGTGIVWFFLGFSKKLNKIVEKVPTVAVRGIQLGLGLILGWAAILLFIDNILLGFISIIIIIVLIKYKLIPAAIILTFMGILVIFYTGAIQFSDINFNMPIFDFQIPTWENILIGMLIVGIAQLLLTLTNVMIASVNLVKDLFPEKEEEIDANSLAFNMGAMNLISPFLGGFPLCHGSGGLAAQYAFGARTGGSMIFEGILELFLGLFFSHALLLLFLNFPKAILGAMLLYTAFLLAKIVFKDFNRKTFPIILTSAILCFLINITLGFIVGLVLFLIFKKKIETQEEEEEEEIKEQGKET
ncbi:MAG: putative sulfate/molybdate transporter [Promethearchaeota archaeon]